MTKLPIAQSDALMDPIRIYPEYAMILTYTVRTGVHERYFRFVSSDFLSTLQKHKLYMQNAWYITYGDAPERQIEFITEKLDYITRLLDTPEWLQLEKRLKGYVHSYSKRVVHYRYSVKVLKPKA